VLVLRGAGRAFWAAYDLGSDADEVLAPGDAVADRDRQAAHVDVFFRIRPRPVIAAVRRYCLAGATQLATSRDVVVVADDAVISASPVLPLGGGFISLLLA